MLLKFAILDEVAERKTTWLSREIPFCVGAIEMLFVRF